MKKLIVITMVVLIACIMVGYGSQNAIAADKAKPGGILKINNHKPAGILGNPQKIFGWNHQYASLALEGLMQYDPKVPNKLIPMLATSWKLSADKSHYTINLRKGVKFHDGTDFNAQAVKWNLDRWLKKPQFRAVASIDVVDDYTIQVNIAKYSNLILNNLDAFGTYMVSPTAIKKNGEDWAKWNPVGTGPFKLVEYQRKKGLKFEKFDGYWKKGLPLLDGLQFTHIKDPMTAMASLKKGDIDVWMEIDPVACNSLAKDSKWKIETALGPNYFLDFNSVDPQSPFSKLKVREALEYAIDREKVAELSGYGRIPVWTILYGIDYQDAGTKPRKYNPEKAKQLLKEAGYPDGFNVTLYFNGLQEKDACTAFQGYLSKVGIKASLEPRVGAAWHSQAKTPLKPNEILYGWLRQTASALKATNTNFVKGNYKQLEMLKEPEGFQKMIQQAFAEPDIDKAMQKLYAAERAAYNFAMFTPILRRQALCVQAPYVKDAIYGYGFMPKFNLEHAWLDK